MPPKIFSLIWLALLLTPGPGQAAVLWQDAAAEQELLLNTSLKGSGLAALAPDDPVLFPESHSAIGLFRARFDLQYADAGNWNGNLAYEHRMRWQSRGASPGIDGNILPSTGEAFYRVAQLDWTMRDKGEDCQWRHEIDRALISLHPDWGEVTIGRQAIGLGRGRIFSAVEMFAPLAPAEMDRAWRRGVDGARAEYRLTDKSSLEGISAWGSSWKNSALLGRARGYLGLVDGEVLLGKRGEDLLAAVTTSAALGDAEIHAEAAVFHTAEATAAEPLFGGEQLVAKAVLGASYTFDVGQGLTLLAEYHYSGFGFARAEEVNQLLAADADRRRRFLRGDSQTLGRHNLGVQASTPLNETVSAAVLLLISASDGSGLASPSITWDLRRNMTLLASLSAPWGTGPSGGVLQSEYGGTSRSMFLQLNIDF